MSYADKVFIQNCKDILANGVWDTDREVRPHWEDGAPAHTVKKFCIVNRYNLREEFPILTVRRQYLKSAIDELLWIWQKKSNNIHDLNSHVWDAWADETGSIGKAYGYQLGCKYACPDVNPAGLEKAFPGIVISDMTAQHNGRLVAYKTPDKDIYMMDQADKVIYDLINNPVSRRIMTNLYNHHDLSEMALHPCAYSMTFNVSGDTLNGILNQRSQDMLTANGWNVMQYAALLMMMAQVTGLKAGELVHVIADAHIYDRHVPIIEELIKRESYPAPVVRLNPEVKDFYQFKPSDFVVEGYNAHSLDQKIEVAV